VGLPLYQDVKNSIPLRVRDHQAGEQTGPCTCCRCAAGVMSALSPNRLRAGMARRGTIAKPPKMAPRRK